MKRIHNRVIIGITVMICVTGAGLRLLAVQWANPLRGAKYGQFSTTEIAAMATKMSNRIWPETRIRFIEAERKQLYDSGQVLHRIWVAQCTDGPENVMVSRWDADTGSLLGISRSRAARANWQKNLSRHDAQRVGIYWLRALNMVQTDPSWRFADTPVYNGASWVFHLRSRHQKALVAVDGGDGALAYAEVSHYLP